MATAKEFVDVALGEVGNGPSKYNTGGQPWCAIFVNWCLRACGDSRQRDARACSFVDMGNLHNNTDGYVPKMGDLIIINLQSDHSWASHVAILESYSADTGKITAINGNGGSGSGQVTNSARSYDSTVTVIEMTWDEKTKSQAEVETTKIFLNPGHGLYPDGTYDPGACGNGYKEAELTREVVRMVEDDLSGYAEVTVYDYNNDLYKNLKNVSYDWSQYDYFLSVHFDAGGGSGTTLYRAKNRTATELENALAEAVATAGGFNNNGVKEHPSNLAVLSATDKAQNGGTISGLLEVCYVDNGEDMQKYTENKNAIAKAISDTLISKLNLVISGGEWSANWQQKKLPNNARALKAKTYERYWKITAKGTKNYEVSCGEHASTHSTKLRVYKDNFLIIALGSYYGPCGTFVKIVFDNGVTIVCIKGDEKDDRETNTEDPAHSYHVDGPGYVENNTISCNLLEIEADVQGSDWQTDFGKALDEYTGAETFNASIAEIYTSDTEPKWNNTYSKAKEKEAEFQNTNEKIAAHNSIFNMPKMIESQSADIAVYVGLRNITESIGAISWTNTKAELATIISFTTAKTDNEYEDMYTPQKGEILRLFLGGEEKYRGIITTDDTGDGHSNSYTASDAGRFLSKSSDTYQFNGIPSAEAITGILSDLSIPIVYMDTEALEGSYISEIYIEKKISEIIFDILDRVPGDWTFDFVPDGIRIYKITTYVAEPKFKMTDNTDYLSSIEYRGNEAISSSVEDLINSVKVISDTNVLAVSRNNNSYNIHGFLQEVVKVGGDVSDPQAIADENLWSLCKETASRSFDIVTELADYTRAGECLCVDDVWYQIISSAHEIKNKRHSVSLELERID